MRRLIINGIDFEVSTSDNQYEVTTWHHNGVLERSIRPTLTYKDMGDAQPYTGDSPPPVPTPHELEDKRLYSLKKSAQRAKTACRRLIINSNLMEMLTITYRENQRDLDLCKKHFKEWVRRMKKALGGVFTYVASFERQERGAMHVHLACHRLPFHADFKGSKIPAWRLGTAVWRSIVGADNGLVFVGGKSKTGAPRRVSQSLGKIAQYVSKYIMKDFEDTPAGLNRYSRSDVITLPKPIRIVVNGTFLEVLSVAFEVPQGYTLKDHRIFGFSNDCCWQMAERMHK